MHNRKFRGNPFIIFISLILTCIVFGSFIVWWQEFSAARSSFAFVIFVWTLVVSNVFLLLTRALREWSDRI